MPGGIDDRNAGGPGGGKELLRRFQGAPRVLAAGARMTLVDFANRAVAALIGLVIEIDRQHRGTASDRNFATIGLIDLDDVLIDDVLPAMIFKIAHRSRLLPHFRLRLHSLCLSSPGLTGRSSSHRPWILDCPVKPGNDAAPGQPNRKML